MILSDRDIKKRLEEGDLKIEPLDDPELQIQPASVDLRLGREFLEFQRSNIPCIHPNSEEETESYTREKIVEEGEDYILHPGDFVLGTTYETVEIPPDLVARVEGRSSLGRLAIVVHASLPYDEEVFLWTPEDGFGFYEIGEIVENEVDARAVSFNPKTLRVSTHRVTDYITNPTKDIYKVTLESGREVRVTEDHNLFTLGEEGEVERVETGEVEGELVMVPNELPDPLIPETEIDLLDILDDEEDVVAYATDGFSESEVDWDAVPNGNKTRYRERGTAPVHAVSRGKIENRGIEIGLEENDYRVPSTVTVTPEFGWVLGFYIAEGCSRRKKMVFTNENRGYLERVESWFEDYDASLSWSTDEEGVYQLTVCSELWSKVFRELGGEGESKRIPERGWNWNDEVLGSLLEALIDGSGARSGSRDSFHTSNEDLVDDVMYLSARLGLINSIYSREPENGEGVGVEHTVEISEEEHKKRKYVPTPSSLLRKYRKKAELTMSEVAEGMEYSSKSTISKVENREYGSVKMKRSTLEDFRDFYRSRGVETHRLDSILEADVAFERVVSVENTGRHEETYDLEVQPDGRSIENFIGGKGGVFLSNTAGFIDPGYRGQITLELSNLGTAPVALRPEEMRISQIVLTELSSRAELPYGAERGSKYQDQKGPTASRIQNDAEWVSKKTDSSTESDTENSE